VNSVKSQDQRVSGVWFILHPSSQNVCKVESVPQSVTEKRAAPARAPARAPHQSQKTLGTRDSITTTFLDSGDELSLVRTVFTSDGRKQVGETSLV
jgi:hypothetical protein